MDYTQLIVVRVKIWPITNNDKVQKKLTKQPQLQMWPVAKPITMVGIFIIGPNISSGRGRLGQFCCWPTVFIRIFIVECQKKV